MKYKLLESQRKFLEVPHKKELDVCVYQGGFGSGKTWAGSLLGILLALKFPGITGLVGAQTYSLVRDTTLISYFEHLERFGMREGRDFCYNKSCQRLDFTNRSKILFRHFDEPNKLKSLNLGFVEIEEMSDIPYETFKMLLGRMRQPKRKGWRGFKYRIFGHTNPEEHKGWIYKTFIASKRENFRFIQAATTENIHLPRGFADNLKNLYDERYYKMNVLGEFDNSKNSTVVKNFTEENVKNIDYNPSLPLHLTCDFNIDPMCWILAHKDNATVWFFDELILENATTVQAAEIFCNKFSRQIAPIIINGDSSGDFRSCTSEYTNYVLLGKTLSNFGFRNVDVHIRHFNPLIKNRIAAFNCMVKSQSGERRLFVDPKCSKLLYNIYNLKYYEGSSRIDLPTIQKIRSDPETKFLGHPFDAASYLVEYYFPII